MTDNSIRPFESTDTRAVHALLEQAFENPGEADLVDALRVDGDMVLELVAEKDGRIVGHIAYSTLQAPVWAVALAPLSVAPSYQNNGIGSALTRQSLHHLKRKNWQAVFVLGDPAYYERFGFNSNMSDEFESNFSSPHFMALELEKDCLKDQHGSVRHAPAFGKLS